MPSNHSPSRVPAREQWLWGLILLGVAVLVVNLQQELTNRSATTAPVFGQYISGQMPLLFRARLLMRVLIDAFASIGLFGGDPARINALLQIAFVGGGLVLVQTVAHALALTRPAPIAAPLLAALFLPWGFLEIGYNLSYPYDLPALLFSALAIWLMLTRRFWLLLAAIVVGTLNKETMFWLLPPFALLMLFEPGPRARRALRVVLCVAAFAAAYFIPRALLDNSNEPSLLLRPRWVHTMRDGTVTQYRIQSNLQELRFNHRGRPYQNIYWVLLPHLAALIGWRRLPRDLKILYAGVPFLLAPLLLWGNLWELRLYNEILPLGAVATAYLLGRFGAEPRDP